MIHFYIDLILISLQVASVKNEYSLESVLHTPWLQHEPQYQKKVHFLQIAAHPDYTALLDKASISPFYSSIIIN